MRAEESRIVDAAFAQGKRQGDKWDNDLRRFFSAADHGDADLPDYYESDNTASRIARMAFESGFKGLDKPIYVRGVRIGELPASGKSMNFLDQHLEPGVSILYLEGNAPTDIGTFALFNRGKQIVVEGWLHYKKGSDGEPILVGARKVETKKTRLENTFQPVFSGLSQGDPGPSAWSNWKRKRRRLLSKLAWRRRRRRRK